MERLILHIPRENRDTETGTEREAHYKAITTCRGHINALTKHEFNFSKKIYILTFYINFLKKDTIAPLS